MPDEPYFFNWTYPAKPPEGDWAYILDIPGIIYNKDSLWPFWSCPNGFNKQVSSPIVVRLSPDTYHQAWSQEYVLSSPNLDCKIAGVSFHISVEPKGLNYIVALCHADINLETFEISDLLCHPDYVTAAYSKLKKYVDFLQQAQKEARKGIERPLTLHEVHHLQGDDDKGAIKKYCWVCIDGCGADYSNYSYSKEAHEKDVSVHSEDFPKHRVYLYERIDGNFKKVI